MGMKLVHIAALPLFLVVSALSAEPSISPAEYLLPEISVLGQAGDGKASVNDFVPTVSELSGSRLEQRSQSTLGETLSREAGVSSTQFGAGASRPVIRGLEGERVRILQSGVGAMDASGTSPDHAVSFDPFLVERVEILRGSASLLYGSNAIGGVINLVNRRIPEKKVGPNLRVNTRFSSVDDGRGGALAYQQPVGKFVFHFDGSLRETEDYAVPGFARSERLRSEQPSAPGTVESQDKVANSANKVWETAVGGSYVRDSGYAGLSYSAYDSRYGVVIEPNVTIDMHRDRIDAGSEWRSEGWLQSTRAKAAFTKYEHKEIDGSTLGTIFQNQAVETRVEFKHRPIGIVEGLFGFQGMYSDLSAQGDEAFLPTTFSSSGAFFFYEESKLGDWTPTLGGRFEYNHVQAKSISEASRHFKPASLSLGTLYALTPRFSLALNANYSERAPNYQELYANGPHLATGIFEIGDTSLGIEKGRSAELSFREKTESSEGRVTAFVQDFTRFISLTDTGVVNPGEDAGDTADDLPEYAFGGTRARFYGAEVEYRRRLPWEIGNGYFEIESRLDWLRGQDRGRNTNLPRITPLRETVTLEYRNNFVRASGEIQHNHVQTRVGPNERVTDGYTWINLNLEAPWTTSFGLLQGMFRVNNLFDVEARNHVSFLKDLAPMPGRNFVLGLQARI